MEDRFTIDETAEVMRISPATVVREWTIARAWLRADLTKSRVLLEDMR